MWGTGMLTDSDIPSARFIPTHVGNSPRHTLYLYRLTVHPHACGEQLRVHMKYHRKDGSSPRMWGTGVPAVSFSLHRRFIPTHVGNRYAIGMVPAATAVHPHACGEQFYNGSCRCYSVGSSPRMWGTALKMINAQHEVRFIPTHVGNSSPSDFPPSSCTVHPHACGEQEQVISRT